MQDGLYSVVFQTPQGTGGGVLVKEGARLMGGDGGYAWRGWVVVDGTDMSGSLEVFRHNSKWSDTVFASLDAYTLNYSGVVKKDLVRLTATSLQVPDVMLRADLRFLGRAGGALGQGR
jgi:hypothetical protein